MTVEYLEIVTGQESFPLVWQRMLTEVSKGKVVFLTKVPSAWISNVEAITDNPIIIKQFPITLIKPLFINSICSSIY